MSAVRIRERLPKFPVAKHERDRLQNGYERGKHPSGNPLHEIQRPSTSNSRARGPTGWSTDFYSVRCRFKSCRARQATYDAHAGLFNAGLGHRLITWLPARQSRFESGSPRQSQASRLPGCRDAVLDTIGVEDPIFECDSRCGDPSVQLQLGSGSKLPVDLRGYLKHLRGGFMGDTKLIKPCSDRHFPLRQRPFLCRFRFPLFRGGPFGLLRFLYHRSRSLRLAARITLFHGEDTSSIP